jgi:hypothetical protein
VTFRLRMGKSITVFTVQSDNFAILIAYALASTFLYVWDVFVTADYLQPHTVKKVSDFLVPSRDVTNQTGGEIKLFPATESLISDFPAEDGKIDHLFYSAV